MVRRFLLWGDQRHGFRKESRAFRLHAVSTVPLSTEDRGDSESGAYGLPTRPGKMASPTKARGLRSLSGVPSCQRRFDIETSVDVVQPAGSYSFSYTVGLLFATTGEGGEPAIEIISTAATGPARYRLPDPFPGFTELALPLLRIPEVRFSVQTFIPQGLARTRALIVVELLRDTLSNPVGLRKLYAAACSKRCKQREEERRSRRAQECRPEGEQQPERPKVELVPELEGKVSCCS